MSTEPAPQVRLAADVEFVIAPKPRASARPRNEEETSTVFTPSGNPMIARKLRKRRLRTLAMEGHKLTATSWEFPVPSDFAVLVNPHDMAAFKWNPGEVVAISSLAKRSSTSVTSGGESGEMVSSAEREFAEDMGRTGSFLGGPMGSKSMQAKFGSGGLSHAIAEQPKVSPEIFFYNY